MQKDCNFQNIYVFYKLFYKENPDFTKEETQAKIQAMFYILRYFSIDKTYDFNNIDKEMDIPFSSKLDCDLKNIISFKGDLLENETKISEFTKRKIEIIGKMVQNETKNKIGNLINFVINLYEEEQNKNNDNLLDLDEIAKTTGIELNDIIGNLNK